MKKIYDLLCYAEQRLKKTILIMKLTTVLILFAMLTAMASSIYNYTLNKLFTKKYFRLASLLFLGLIVITACKKETSAPTAKFTSEVTGNSVTFTAETTNADRYEWNFGDGTIKATVQNPIHTYANYGQDYPVTLTVVGPGAVAEANATVTIAPKSKMELLTGGSATTNSKKWRISSGSGITFAQVNANFTVLASYPAGILSQVGLSQVYSDEFVFHGDGSLTINSNGGGILAGYEYCNVNGISYAPGANPAHTDLAYASPFTPPSGATFAINEGKDLTISTTSDGITTSDVSYKNVTTLSFTKKGFLGIMDFMTECIVQHLTDTQMTAVFFLSAVPSGAAKVGKATSVVIFTFEVAP